MSISLNFSKTKHLILLCFLLQKGEIILSILKKGKIIFLYEDTELFTQNLN